MPTAPPSSSSATIGNWAASSRTGRRSSSPRFASGTDPPDAGDCASPAAGLVRHEEQAGDADAVEDEHGERVDAHAEDALAGAEDQTGNVDAGEEDAECGEIDVGRLRVREHRFA